MTEDNEKQIKDDKTLGTKIRKLRENQGMSQYVLAKKLGYESDTAISLIERGDRNLPIDKLKLVSRFFNVSLGELLGETKTDEKNIYDTLRADSRLNEKDVELIGLFIEFLITKKVNS